MHRIHPYARSRRGGDLVDYIPSTEKLYDYGKQAFEGYHDTASTFQPYVALAARATGNRGLHLASDVLALSHAHRSKKGKTQTDIEKISRNNADTAVPKKDYGLPIHPASNTEGLTQPVNTMYYRSGAVGAGNVYAARPPRTRLRRQPLKEAGYSSSGYFGAKQSKAPRSRIPSRSKKKRSTAKSKRGRR